MIRTVNILNWQRLVRISKGNIISDWINVEHERDEIRTIKVLVQAIQSTGLPLTQVGETVSGAGLEEKIKNSVLSLFHIVGMYYEYSTAEY